MRGYDLEGADRVTTVGASDDTMRIWNELKAAGEQGLTRDEILERVGPHINRGHARRRYFTRRKRTAAYRRAAHVGDYEDPNDWPLKSRESAAARDFRERVNPTWENTDIDSALRFVVTQTLANMTRASSAVRIAGSRYRAGRQPRHRDPSIIDMSGDRTRIHMNSVNALRIIEPALKRFDTSSHAQLTSQEKVALKRLVELHKEMLRDATARPLEQLQP